MATKTVESQACLFFDRLPLELRERIYEQAYATGPNCELVVDPRAPNGPGFRTKWLKYSPQGRGHSESWYLTYASFMVSRRYFAEAFPALLQHNRLHLRANRPLLQFLARNTSWQQNIRSISTRFNINDDRIWELYFAVIKSLPRLIELHVRLADSLEGTGYLDCTGRLSKEVLALFRHIREIRGLRSFAVDIPSFADEGYLRGKIAVLEEETRRLVTLPKELSGWDVNERRDRV